MVETANLKFNHQSRFGVGYLTGLSDERLRVVERFAMVDANTLTYRATVEDSTVFVRPWTVELSMDRTAGPLYEVACHEGNYGIANILSGILAIGVVGMALDFLVGRLQRAVTYVE